MNTYNIPISAGMWHVSTGTCNTVSLEPIYPQDCTAPCKPDYPKGFGPNKKEKAMYVSDDKHIESSKINYLSDRIENAYYKANDKARKAFGLEDDTPPQTAEDFIKRIQDGKFMLNDETKKKNVYEPSRYIRWRDPSVKEDKEGFEADMKEFGALQQDARDAVAVLSPAEALAEVKKLDAWIPSKGNS